MKLWINRCTYGGGYSGGLAIVAANSAEEAHGVLIKHDSFYKDWYEANNWECIENAYVDTEEPYFIAEDSHEG